MAALDKVENTLNGVFGKVGMIPDKAKETIAQVLPWASLVLGVLSLASAYSLWNWAHVANGFADYANQVSRAFGGGDVVSDRLTAGIWLGLIVLVLEAACFLLAFPGLQKRAKSGWNLLFYAVLLELVYWVVLLFTDYGGSIGYLIGAVVGLWLVFQVRSKYVGRKA